MCSQPDRRLARPDSHPSSAQHLVGVSSTEFPRSTPNGVANGDFIAHRPAVEPIERKILIRHGVQEVRTGGQAVDIRLRGDAGADGVVGDLGCFAAERIEHIQTAPCSPLSVDVLSLVAMRRSNRRVVVQPCEIARSDSPDERPRAVVTSMR